MMRTLLVRGMLGGLAAGLLAFVVAWVVGEPSLNRAIALEASGAQPGEPELVSRAVQSTLGLVVGLMLTGVALGGALAVVFAYVQGRHSSLMPRATAALLAAVGFSAFFLVPFLKYPANPPAVGDPETVGTRTVLHLAMVGVSLAAAVAGAVTSRRLAPRIGRYRAGYAAVGVFLGLTCAAVLLLPAAAATPEGFPGDLLWQFRLSSVAVQAALWAGLAVFFGLLADRAMGVRPGAA
jgi:hypothetical protein